MPAQPVQRRPDYGVDGYPFLVGLLSAGAIGLFVGGGLVFATTGVAAVLGAVLMAAGGLALVPAALGIRYVITGKFAHRDRLLSEVSWRGDERVLDIGTGGGLLAIGAARRAPRGRAIGIDIWQREDLSGNTRDRAIANARLEGVGDRVEIRDEDARTLSCADASIDVVLSMLCLHNIPEVAGREQVLREIARVLKPGGTALVSDLAGTERYAQVFAELGLEVKRSGRCAGTFPWQRLVVARKR